jgi:hypothetical protein
VTALTDAEKLFVRQTVLVFESTASAASETDVNAALDALDAPGRQSLRAHIAAYTPGMTTIDGGSRAAHYDPTEERWSIRNGIRSLLTGTGLISLPQEDRPATADSIQLVSLNLASYDTGDEWAS